MTPVGVVAALTVLACAGLWVAWAGARPHPASLAATLDRLYGPPGARRGGPVERLAGAARSGPARRLASRSRLADLRVLGRTPDDEAARRAVAVAAGVASGPVLAVAAGIAGVSVPSGAAAVVSLVGLGVGLVRPMRSVAREAAARRRAYRWQLAMFLLAVGMCLSAGYGVETALKRAVKAGRGGLFDEVDRAVDRARLHREPPWARLRALGEELGVEDLSELAENVALAGDDGARIRDAVIKKADALFVRILTEDEADANEATESMHLPTVVLLFSFMAFTAVPALSWGFRGFTR